MPRSLLLACALALTLALAPAGRALAQGPALQLLGEAPFTGAELRTAAELRIPHWPGLEAQVLTVRSLAPGTIELELQGWRRSLELGSATGADAARLVALSLADLVLAVSSSGEQAATSATRPAVGPSASRDGSGRSPQPGPRSALTWTRVALGAHASKGAGELEPWSFGLGLAVSRAWRPWLLDAELGWSIAPAHGRPVLRSSWNAARLRVNGGVRLGFVELLAGPSLMPLWVSGGDGFFALLSAVGISARAVVRLGPALDAVLAAGSDLYLRRVELQAYGTSVIASPRFAPWLGLALGWRGS